MYRLFTSVTLWVLTLLLLIGCLEEGDCLNQASNLAVLGFYTKSTLAQKTLDIDSVRVSGIEESTNIDTQLTSLTVPLDPVTSSVTISIYQPSGLSTVTVDYSTRTNILDPACGAADLFTLNQVAVTGADSIRIVQPKLSNSITTHVKIYF